MARWAMLRPVECAMPRRTCLAFLSLALACAGSPEAPPISSDVSAIPPGNHALSVRKRSVAGADGRIHGEGIDCGSQCDGSYSSRTLVTLRSDDDTFQSFTVDCPGRACQVTTSSTLVLDLRSDHQVIATFRAHINYIFVTSTGQSSSMGGLAGADAICLARAKEAGLGGSRYVAWLSSSTVAAPSRLAAARGWMRTDGLPVADSVESLIDGQIFYPPRLDEYGADVAVWALHAPSWTQPAGGFVPVWTGSNWNYQGTLSGTCHDWTTARADDAALVGSGVGGSGIWTVGALYACDGWKLRMYCLETDYDTPVAPPP